jgi:hypothetical protein
LGQSVRGETQLIIQMMEATLIERHENWQTEDPPDAQARRHGSQQDLKEKLSLHMADNRQARRKRNAVLALTTPSFALLERSLKS